MKADPDYSRGYFAAVDGKPRELANSAYAIGYDAGERTRQLLHEYGFKKRGRVFSKRLSS